MKANRVPRLEAEVPADSGTGWEGRGGGWGSGEQKPGSPWLVKDTDSGRRQRRLLAARGYKATIDEAGVSEHNGLQAFGSQTTAEEEASRSL